MKDNLFDFKITPLDFVKVALLIVTMFSSYNIADLITPDVPFAFIRELAMVAVVEGAFIGFEYATKDAKTVMQTRYATVGFFCSLAVLILFLGVSGLIEFGGPTLLTQDAGMFLGIAWRVKDWVMLFALVVASAWLFLLAAIYRLYSLADPDKQAELARNQTNGDMQSARNKAFDDAMKQAQPVITIRQALVDIRAQYAGVLGPAELESLMADVEAHLRKNTHGVPPASAPAAPLPVFAPLARPTRPLVTPSQPVVAGNGNGNGQHPTP